MKNKYQIWYIGYIISILLIFIILLTDFPQMVDMGLAMLFSIIFSISHVQILHNKMMKNDNDYKINVMDERHIMIKEKTGNITNMVNTTLLAFATIIFICLDYIIPAIITGLIITIQPFILITISTMLEKKL